MRLLALVNEQLWIGHFDLWRAEGVIMYRNALLLTEGMEAGTATGGDARRGGRGLRRALTRLSSSSSGRESPRRRRLRRRCSNARRSLIGMIPGAQPLLLIGAGKMGGAMLESWLAVGLTRRWRRPDPYLEGRALAQLAQARGRDRESVAEAADRDYRVIVLAVKPQSMAEAWATWRLRRARHDHRVDRRGGASFRRSRRRFPKKQAIVRAMPNTPAQVGMSMTVAAPNAAVTSAKRAMVGVLFDAIGELAWVEDETLIDAVTAVSGQVRPMYSCSPNIWPTLLATLDCRIRWRPTRPADRGGLGRSSRREPVFAGCASQECYLSRRIYQLPSGERQQDKDLTYPHILYALAR